MYPRISWHVKRIIIIIIINIINERHWREQLQVHTAKNNDKRRFDTMNEKRSFSFTLTWL